MSWGTLERDNHLTRRGGYRLIKAFLFDLDVTLLDREASVEPFVKELYVRYGLNHIPYQAYWEYFKGLDKRGYADKQEVFQTLVTEHALPVSVDELIADFRQNAWRGCREFLFPDAEDVLRQPRWRGYKLDSPEKRVNSQMMALHVVLDSQVSSNM